MLIILGGLPASGKSTIAAILAQDLPAVHLRIDTVEQALKRAGCEVSGPEGYEISGSIAEDNLKLGHIVVADSVNPIRWTRDFWRAVAVRANTSFTEVEIVCTDPVEHRRRAETRIADIHGHVLPSWQKILDRDYEPWDVEGVIDTAIRTPQQSAEILKARLA